MKTYVLIISQTFPEGHPKQGKETNFNNKIKLALGCPDCSTNQDLSGENISNCNSCVRACADLKLHTIRKNYELWKDRITEVKEGNAILSLRQWTGRAYNSKQKEIYKITKENNPSVQHVFMTYNPCIGYEASVSSKELFGAIEREALSKNDGLSVWDFSDWFFERGKIDEFSGAIIHFTDFRYKKHLPI